MDTITLFGEDILIIPEELAPKPRAKIRWRAARWIKAVGLAGATALVAFVVTHAVGNAVRESHRTRCTEQLKRLGLAFQEYHEARGHFPAPMLSGADGRPLLSWRVAILPHLGYQSLYQRFHLDEPWDSRYNRALLAEMPPEFKCPSLAARKSGRTGYLVVVGPPSDMASVNTPFELNRGVEIREITDGTSNTILVFETDALVPWTKPDDLQWAQGSPPPDVTTPHPGGTHALFADGSTRLIKTTISPDTLRSLLTINGGEVVGGG
jgi:prepilin-type processing-associated H-X9-DG protein